MRRRTLEEKLEAIRLVEEGNSPRSVSDRLHILPEISSKHGIASSTLVGWLSKFNKGGKDALARKQPSPREQSKSIMKRLPKEECEKENEKNFFRIMKSELLYAKKYTSMDSFITDLKEYMEYYNNERIKLRLNGMSPVLYRKAFEQAHSY